MKRSCKYEFATATKVHTSHKYDETSYHWTSFAQKYEKKPGKNEIFVEGFSFKERSATHDNNDDDGDDDDGDDDDDNDFDVGDDSWPPQLFSAFSDSLLFMI